MGKGGGENKWMADEEKDMSTKRINEREGE